MACMPLVLTFHWLELRSHTELQQASKYLAVCPGRRKEVKCWRTPVVCAASPTARELKMNWIF